MMKSEQKKLIVFAAVFGITMALSAQSSILTTGAQDVADTIRGIARIASSVIGGAIGLFAVGRSGWKFMHGEPDSTTSLLTGIVAVVLGQVAGMFLR
jgi:hypothetical protein